MGFWGTTGTFLGGAATEGVESWRELKDLNLRRRIVENQAVERAIDEAQSRIQEDWLTGEQVERREDALVASYPDFESQIREGLYPKTEEQRRSAAMQSIPEALRATVPWDQFQQFAAPFNLSDDPWAMPKFLPEGQAGPPSPQSQQEWFDESQEDWNRAYEAASELTGRLAAAQEKQAEQARYDVKWENRDNSLDMMIDEWNAKNQAERTHARAMIPVDRAKMQSEYLEKVRQHQDGQLSKAEFEEMKRFYEHQQHFNAYISQRPSIEQYVMPDGTTRSYSWRVLPPGQDGQPVFMFFDVTSQFEGTPLWAALQARGGAQARAQQVWSMMNQAGIEIDSAEGSAFMEQAFGSMGGVAPGIIWPSINTALNKTPVLKNSPGEAVAAGGDVDVDVLPSIDTAELLEGLPTRESFLEEGLSSLPLYNENPFGEIIQRRQVPTLPEQRVEGVDSSPWQVVERHDAYETQIRDLDKNIERAHRVVQEYEDELAHNRNNEHWVPRKTADTRAEGRNAPDVMRYSLGADGPMTGFGPWVRSLLRTPLESTGMDAGQTGAYVQASNISAAEFAQQVEQRERERDEAQKIIDQLLGLRVAIAGRGVERGHLPPGLNPQWVP